MKVTNNLPTSFVVVALGSMWAAQQFVEEGTVLEVERAVRNDWIGSKLARDATDEEVAAYRADQGDDEVAEVISGQVKELARKKGDLEEEIYDLEQARTGLLAQRDTLTAEIATLEKAKATATKQAAAK
jgi:sarcosine oxidase delta subunit